MPAVGVVLQHVQQRYAMGVLILGLVLFLGVHSVRIVAEDFRTRQIARMGANTWKLSYTAVSVVGLVLLVWGYGLARQQPVVLWPQPPVWTRHLAALLTLVSFILLAAAQVPGNALKARLQHPMVLGVKVWAFAHLLANNTLADLLLFGSFLVWAVLDFRSARRRGPVAMGAVSAGRTVVAVAAGVVAWAAFAFWLHGALIGVRPFGM
jgi:uncharacterized membrane protein